jgi:circadian clock protein KaiB
VLASPEDAVMNADPFPQPAPKPVTAGLKLRLFIAGNTPRSMNAILALRQLCAEHVRGEYQLEIVDIYQQPALAREAQILATPTLIKYEPAPKKIMIGDLSRTERVLSSLGLSA